MSVVRSAVACMIAATLGGLALAHRSPERPYPTGRGDDPVHGRLASAAPAGAWPNQSRMTGGGGVLTIEPDRLGQYHANMEVEGRQVPVLVDTGASYVALSYESAQTLGIVPAPADFTWAMRTANGTSYAAPIRIPEVRVGPIAVRNVQAVVTARGALTGGALLGMSFLRGLSGFAVNDGRLVLTQ